MPVNKNQHFVPQFYLRYFSNNQDQKTITVWNIEKDLFIKSSTIKDQVSLPYFYGKNSELDRILQKQETLMGTFFKERLIESEKLFIEKGKEHIQFLDFITTTLGRTKFAADQSNEAIETVLKTAFKNSPEFKNNIDEFKIYSKEAPLITIKSCTSGNYILSDLAFKMIINKSIIPFILSDHPIILHNQFLRDKKFLGGHTGFSQTGLQIFIPISPTKMIIFYDRKIYKLGKNKKDSVFEIINQEDINTLNKLQFVNAYKTIYFNEQIDETYCQKISKKVKKLRKINKTNIQKLSRTNNTNDFIIISSKPTLDIDLELSFIKVKKVAKKLKINPNRIPIRNLEMIRKHEEILKQINHKKRPLLKYLLQKIKSIFSS